MRIYRLRGESGEAFPCPPNMPEALHRLLMRRGIRTAEEAERFLDPGVAELNDPFLLSDMDRAVAAIQNAIRRGTRIVVFGDYDVDGVCSSAILSEYLHEAGADVEVYLPSRHREGYGLNEAAIRTLAQHCGLMVTVDCGISCADLVELAESLGLECVVTDHHRPEEKLPACPTVNPLLNGYPFPYLCGAGVAFQLVAALAGREKAMDYIDLAALATVADVVSLTGENRAIVRLGLEKINREPRPGLQALIESAGLLDREINAGNVSFQLAPRLNAGGRIGSALRSMDLLVETDAEKARALAAELEAANDERRSQEQKILTEALAQLRDFDFPGSRAIVLVGRGWNPGIIGLAASKIVERFHYPTILLASDGETCTGSCRSIEGVDIFEALTAVKQYFVRYGGHKQAAGLTIMEKDVPDFIRDLNACLAENIPPEVYIPVEEYDLDVSFADLGDVFVERLNAIQPTGMGNPAPVFRCAADVREARAVGRDGAHLKLRLMQDDRLLDAICFQQGHLAGELAGEQDLLFTPKINDYMGRRSVQLEVRSIDTLNVFERIRANVPLEGRYVRRFLTDILYNRTYSDPPETPPAIPVTALAEHLGASVQGTLIVAASLEAAEHVLRAAGGRPLDLTIGAYPRDPRCFNAVAVLPVGEPPRGWRQCLLAGLPLNVTGLPVQALDGVPVPSWRRQLPDVDALRELYKAVRRLLARPVYARTLEALCHSLSEEAAQPETAAVAGLLALHDLHLVDLQLAGERAELRLPRMQKTDPESSAVFRRALFLRAQA